MAAALYRAEHGELPRQVDDLVPELLDAVPIDPFNGEPIKMITTEEHVVIYSVGSDGIDRKGAEPSDRYDESGDIIFRLPR